VYESLARAQPKRAQDRRNLALVYRYMGGVLERLLRSDEALRLYGQAIGIDRDLLAAEADNATTRLDLSFDLASLAKLHASENHLEPAIGGLREALELRRSVLAADPVNAQARAAVARAHGDLAGLLFRKGDRPAAEAEARRSVAERERLAAGGQRGLEPPLQLARALLTLGDLLRGPSGHEACALYRRSRGLFAGIADRAPSADRTLGETLSQRLAGCETRGLRK
jgi:tetratricopeptide (TPR) repeat protein